MIVKKAVTLAVAVALGASMLPAHADSREYRYEHRDGRDVHRDYRRDRYERERYVERHHRHYVVERPVYVAPRVIYAQQPAPSSFNIIVPIQLP